MCVCLRLERSFLFRVYISIDSLATVDGTSCAFMAMLSSAGRSIVGVNKQHRTR